MSRKRQNLVTVGLISLGCPKNTVDSERMLAEIAGAGHVIETEPDNADVVVINTCGFIAPARAEAIDVIEQALEWKAEGRVRKVIVAGCLPERLGRRLLDEVEGVDAVMGLGQRDNVVEIINRTLSAQEPALYLEDYAGKCSDDRGRLLTTAGHWAYLRISEGCDHRCSFCTIPSIRGPFRSKTPDMVLAEAEELVSAGVVELNLIAQDTTSYGRDLGMKNGLAELLRGLEKISGLVWVRLMYLWPSGVSDELIEAVAASEKVVHYLDIPIQHVNDRVLKAMGRPDTKQRICRLIEKLREVMADITLRTTLITGFPGETDDEFAELVEFVKWAKFDALGCFRFYAESGTAAAEMPGQVPDQVKEQRLEEVMLTQQEIAFAKNEERVASKLVCLVDFVGADDEGEGRFYGQAPEVDSICLIGHCKVEPGRFVETKMVGTRDYDLVVRSI